MQKNLRAHAEKACRGTAFGDFFEGDIEEDACVDRWREMGASSAKAKSARPMGNQWRNDCAGMRVPFGAVWKAVVTAGRA
ncbi:MAG: hypothetical protein LBV73_00940 [Paraburkholderia sp.]|jgi:hypothetical protein|nr:hypothetical protein [Paraburkholderia sp.]